MDQRSFPRALLALLAAGLLTGAQDCDDNLGDGAPGAASFRLSIAPNQVDANSDSLSPSLSADGRYACFASRANNLATPTSPFREIFVRDRWNDTVVNVSKLANLDFPAAAADCFNPVMSPNGRWVVFECRSELLWDVGTETYPGFVNLFFVDLETPPFTINRVGFEADGDCTLASVSDNGRVVFQSDATSFHGFANPGADSQIYLNYLGTTAVELISHQMGSAVTPADADSERARISSDGTRVVFQSFATDLTAEPNPDLPSQSTGARRIYRALHDGSGMELVSRATGPAGTPADNHCASASISADGRYVAYLYQGGAMTVPDTTGTFCVIRRDTVTHATDLVGLDPFMFALFVSYADADPTGISADGRYVAYTGMNGTFATATDLQVKVRDMQGGTVIASKFILTEGSTLDNFPGVALSQDGRWVAWKGDSKLEVVGDDNAVPDVFGYGPIH